jgi:3-methylfumaryl-CoA hydratase
MLHALDRAATLDEGDPLPPLFHWAYFLTSVPHAELGSDGHPARGGFLPPVSLPRRMRAGGRFRFDGDLRLGAEASRVSTIGDIAVKTGSTGRLCFITVHHVTTAGGGTLVEEEDIVYRDDPAPDAPPATPRPAPEGAVWSETVTPTPVMLFRYSALTYNGHRIHYDRTYARDVEGYPNLVVHGPLTATLLARLAVEHGGGPLATFGFRASAPLFDDRPFRLCGAPTDEGARLWAETADGALAMTAEATYR